MQHCPSSLVAPESKHALQPQRTDAMLLTGDVPNGGEPDAKFGACLVENSPRRCRRLMSACGANQSAATHSLDFGYHPAFRADQPINPAQLLQVVSARLFRVK